MLLQQFGKLWALIQRAIEPLMVVVRAIGDGVKSICNIIEGAINSIPGVNVDMGCNRLRATGHRHIFWSSPDTPLHIAEAIVGMDCLDATLLFIDTKTLLGINYVHLNK